MKSLYNPIETSKITIKERVLQTIVISGKDPRRKLFRITRLCIIRIYQFLDVNAIFVRVTKGIEDDGL